MAARPLVAQGPVDQEEEGRGKPFGHKPRRGDAHKGAASESEQFLGDQDGKRGSDRAADHAIFGVPSPPAKEARMETGPVGILGGPSRVGEVLDKFPVEIQEASGRNRNLGRSLPDPGRLQQVCRREDGRFQRVVSQKRYPGVFSHGPPPSPSRPWPFPGRSAPWSSGGPDGPRRAAPAPPRPVRPAQVVAPQRAVLGEVDELRVPEDREVLGDVDLGDGEDVLHVGHAPRPLAEFSQDLEAGGVREGLDEFRYSSFVVLWLIFLLKCGKILGFYKVVCHLKELPNF